MTVCRLLHAKNEAALEPAMNLQIAQVYLEHGDPALSSRTWQHVMEQMISTKTGNTRERWEYAIKDTALAVWFILLTVSFAVIHKVGPFKALDKKPVLNMTNSINRVPPQERNKRSIIPESTVSEITERGLKNSGELERIFFQFPSKSAIFLSI